MTVLFFYNFKKYNWNKYERIAMAVISLYIKTKCGGKKISHVNNFLQRRESERTKLPNFRNFVTSNIQISKAYFLFLTLQNLLILELSVTTTLSFFMLWLNAGWIFDRFALSMQAVVPCLSSANFVPYFMNRNTQSSSSISSCGFRCSPARLCTYNNEIWSLFGVSLKQCSSFC